MAVPENEAERELQNCPFYRLKCVMGKSTSGSFNREDAARGQTIFNGMPIFKKFGGRFDLKQIDETPYECGITVHIYLPARAKTANNA